MTPPQIGSLWVFRGLEERIVFVVVASNDSSVQYKEAGVQAPPTTRPTQEFLDLFEPTVEGNQ